MRLTIFPRLWPVLLSLWLAACASGPPADETQQIRAAYVAGNYAAAADAAAAGLAQAHGQNLLQLLEAGLALHAAGRWRESNAAFDAAEELLMWKSHQLRSADDVARLLGGMLAGDDAFPYPGRIFEGVLVNTYKGLNDMMLGDSAAARVEFNRMAARQENAVQQLAAKVAALQADATAPADASEEAAADIATARQALGPELTARLAAIPRFPREGDIRNPYSDYLAGLFRAGTGLDTDLPAALGLLRNAAALSGDGGAGNAYVIQDYAALESGATLRNRVVVVYEDGLGPALGEWRIDLPLPGPDGQILPVSLALPEFRSRAAAYGTLQVRAGNQVYPLRRLLDMDALAGTEFRAGYNGLVARAVTAAILKSLAYHTVDRALVKSGDDSGLADLFRFAMIATQVATTRADTRMVSLLPKSIFVASFPFPDNRGIEILTPGGAVIGRVFLAALADKGPVVVRIRVPVAGAPAALHVSGTGAVIAGP